MATSENSIYRFRGTTFRFTTVVLKDYGLCLYALYIYFSKSLSDPNIFPILLQKLEMTK